MCIVGPFRLWGPRVACELGKILYGYTFRNRILWDVGTKGVSEDRGSGSVLNVLGVVFLFNNLTEGTFKFYT